MRRAETKSRICAETKSEAESKRNKVRIDENKEPRVRDIRIKFKPKTVQWREGSVIKVIESVIKMKCP